MQWHTACYTLQYNYIAPVIKNKHEPHIDQKQVLRSHMQNKRRQKHRNILITHARSWR